MNFNLIDESTLSVKRDIEFSYQSQMRGALKNTEELNHFFKSDLKPNNYKIFIPRKFAQKIKDAGIDSPLWKQFMPDIIEDDKIIQRAGMLDPIGDETHQKSGPLIHRYKNRVLFFPTNICPIACRYCFRKNELDDSPELFNKQYSSALKYLSEHKEIEEVIFSGGDPFILSDQKIEKYLEDFNQIPHLKFIRFHTRTPIIIPERITNSLVQILKKQSQKIIIAIHTNHLSEIDADVESAIKKLNSSKALLLSQSVLLKGVNDRATELLPLMQKIVELNIRPYYLHHPDLVKGGMHFYLPLEQGRKIYSELKASLSGWACPQYIIDIPGGEGKTSAYNPETFKYSGELINSKGDTVSHIDKF